MEEKCSASSSIRVAKAKPADRDVTSAGLNICGLALAPVTATEALVGRVTTAAKALIKGVFVGRLRNPAVNLTGQPSDVA